MINVGVIDAEGKTLTLLKKILSDPILYSLSCEVCCVDLSKNIDNEVVLDILLVLDKSKQNLQLKHNQVRDDIIVVVNSDAKHHYLSPGATARFVTYGMDNKATMTSSSIMEDMTDQINPQTWEIVCCVQRDFTTWQGKNIERQEFKITSGGEQDTYSILAAVSASIVCGADIDLLERLRL